MHRESHIRTHTHTISRAAPPLNRPNPSRGESILIAQPSSSPQQQPPFFFGSLSLSLLSPRSSLSANRRTELYSSLFSSLSPRFSYLRKRKQQQQQQQSAPSPLLPHQRRACGALPFVCCCCLPQRQCYILSRLSFAPQSADETARSSSPRSSSPLPLCCCCCCCCCSCGGGGGGSRSCTVV